jgi:hypothetical protein
VRLAWSDADYRRLPAELLRIAKETEADESRRHAHLDAIDALGELRMREAIPYLVRTIEFFSTSAFRRELLDLHPHASALTRFGGDAVLEIVQYLQRRAIDEVSDLEIELYAHVIWSTTFGRQNGRVIARHEIRRIEQRLEKAYDRSLVHARRNLERLLAELDD